MDVVAWLLAGDPAIAWQTMRDLTGATPNVIAAERRKVPHEGIGATILASQGPDGPWHLADEPDWLPTLYTMLLLRSTGADPFDPLVASAVARLEAGYEWDEEFRDKPDKTFFEGETEPCINGGILALGASFGRPCESLARRLLRDQLVDGGWNCDAPQSAVSSYHSTICVLEGLLAFERAVDGDADVATARRRGENYLLDRSLFKRLSTGEPASAAFGRFAFPPRYHYDVLRGLDYLRDAGLEPSPRLREAVALVRAKAGPDGRWPLDASYAEALAVPIGETLGEPSRWNTLRAMRVLHHFG